MTDQELIKALRCCISYANCDMCQSECIFYKDPKSSECIPAMGETVIARLEALLAENEGLKQEVQKKICEKSELEREIGRLEVQNERLKAQAPEWVSVAERLPEKDGRYLCVRRIGESGMCYVTIMNGDECGFSMGHIYSDDVTHWQPLPKPLSTEGVGK